MEAGDCCRDDTVAGLTPADRYVALVETERNHKLLEWLAALGGAITVVAVVVKAVASLPPVKSYFSDRREYKKMRDREQDVLKAILTSRIGKIIRQDDDTSHSIKLVPVTNGSSVWKSHLDVAGSWYVSALEYLVSEGYLSKRDGEGGSTYILTSPGERVIERFANRLCSHQFTGRFRDGVHQAKLARLNTQMLIGTVHTAIGAEPLGMETEPYANILCIPPAEQNDGVVAKAYIIAEGLPVAKGDTVFVKFEDTPYHIHTYLTPRWAGNRFLGEGEKQVPTATLAVRDIQPSGNGNQILSLSPGRLMRPVRTGGDNGDA